MLKVTFKEVKVMFSHVTDDIVHVKDMFPLLGYAPKADVLCVSFGFPSELVPSREEVLSVLGISKQQDDAMQAKYSIEHAKPSEL